MKFISKFSNYRVVLRPGLPGNRATGTQPVPGLYVKFEGGIAEVKNTESIELMKRHAGFINGDFIIAPGDGVDTFATARKDTEPSHNVVDIEYGHVGKNINPKPLAKLSDEQMKSVKEIAAGLAVSMIKDMLPKAVEQEIAKRNQVKVAGSEIADAQSAPQTKSPKVTAPEPIEDDSVADDAGEMAMPNVIRQETAVGGEEVDETGEDKPKKKLGRPRTIR